MRLIQAAARTASALALAGVISCGGGAVPPAVLDTRNESCAQCRMVVSVQRFAAQIVAPSEEPRFFDDVGCLRDYLQRHREVAPDAIAYVADHRTGEWVASDRAVFTRTERVQTPMASGVIAHRSTQSRDLDRDADGGTDIPASSIVGALASRRPR